MTDAEATVRSSIVDAIASTGVHPGSNFDPIIDAILRTVFERCVRWSVRELADELDAKEAQ